MFCLSLLTLTLTFNMLLLRNMLLWVYCRVNFYHRSKCPCRYYIILYGELLIQKQASVCPRYVLDVISQLCIQVGSLANFSLKHERWRVKTNASMLCRLFNLDSWSIVIWNGLYYFCFCMSNTLKIYKTINRDFRFFLFWGGLRHLSISKWIKVHYNQYTFIGLKF